MTKALLLAIFLLPSFPAFAREGRVSRPLHTGIVFPGFNLSVSYNPAALPLTPDERALRGSYGPPSQGPIHDFGAGFAMAGKQFGFGAVYEGRFDGAMMAHGIDVGGAVRFADFGIGLTVGLTPQGGGGFGTSYLIGAELGSGKGFQMAATFDLDIPTLGVGWGEGKKYGLEINLQLPAISSLGSPSMTFVPSVGGVIYVGPVGFSAIVNTSLSTAGGLGGLGYEVGASLNLFRRWYFTAVYDGQVTLALTVGL